MPVPQELLAANLRWNLFPPNTRIGVSVSGGADSVALTRALLDLAEPNRWTIILLHVNHHLRGPESDGDARFVTELAEKFSLACQVADLPFSGEGNIEQETRDARRQWLRSLADRLHLHNIAQGHTRSDQAETVLFRFLRGSGTAGLAAIRPVSADGVFVRPLLECTREETREYLREITQPWREDSSNQSLSFDRNRIRLALLPQLVREWNPALEEALAATAQWAQAEENYWACTILHIAAQHCTVRVIEPTGSALDARIVTLPAAALETLPLAVARRLVRHALSLVRGDLRQIDFPHVEAIRALAAQPNGSGRLQVPGVDVLRSFDWLRLAPPGSYAGDRFFSLALQVPGNFLLPDGDSALLLQVENDDTLYNEDGSRLDQDRLTGPLVLRTWQPGDGFRPSGRASETKLKTMFQEARIPIWERRSWPVVVMDGAIVWSRRFGAAVDFAAGSCSRRVVTVSEQPVETSSATSQNRNQVPDVQRL